MASTPVLYVSPTIGTCALATANTNRDGSTGTYASFGPAPAGGTRYDRFRIAATGATTAGVIRFFIYGGPSFPTTSLLYEVLVPAITPSATVAVFQTEVDFGFPIILPETFELRASTHNAEGFNVFAFGAAQ